MRLFAEATTDYEQLVRVVARRMAEVLKNTCTVKILSDDGTVVIPVAVHATEPAVADRIHAVLAANPIRVDSHALYREVLETGKPALIPKVERQHLEKVSSPHAEASRHARTTLRSACRQGAVQPTLGVSGR